jgi:uncharacterized lipoprotein YmbA
MPIASLRTFLMSFALGGLLLVSGCVDIGGDTAPSRFYVLSATDTQATPSPDGMAILLGPVTLPRYLDRPQIVTRPTPNELSLAEYDRWGGRLDDNVARVLAQDIGVHLNTSRVAIFPREQRLADAIQISIDVSRFEQVGNRGNVELDAQWSLSPANRRGAPTIGTSRIRTPVAGSGFADTAAAMSAALDKLAEELAAAARKLPPAPRS